MIHPKLKAQRKIVINISKSSTVNCDYFGIETTRQYSLFKRKLQLCQPVYL